MRNEAKMESISMDSAENNPARVQYTMQGTEVPKGCFMSVTDPQPPPQDFFLKETLGSCVIFFFFENFLLFSLEGQGYCAIFNFPKKLMISSFL